MYTCESACLIAYTTYSAAAYVIRYDNGAQTSITHKNCFEKFPVYKVIGIAEWALRGDSAVTPRRSELDWRRRAPSDRTLRAQEHPHTRHTHTPARTDKQHKHRTRCNCIYKPNKPSARIVYRGSKTHYALSINRQVTATAPRVRPKTTVTVTRS